MHPRSHICRTETLYSWCDVWHAYSYYNHASLVETELWKRQPTLTTIACCIHYIDEGADAEYRKLKMLVCSAFNFYHPEHARRQITRESLCISRFQRKLKSKKCSSPLSKGEPRIAMCWWFKRSHQHTAYDGRCCSSLPESQTTWLFRRYTVRFDNE